MKLFPKQPTIRYWVNGYGPFDTPEERDQMHGLLRELADHNRRALDLIEKRIEKRRP